MINSRTAVKVNLYNLNTDWMRRINPSMTKL